MEISSKFQFHQKFLLSALRFLFLFCRVVYCLRELLVVVFLILHFLFGNHFFQVKIQVEKKFQSF
jgi:hypothetical protein